MKSYAQIDYGKDYITISFDVSDEAIMAIGSRMNEICEEAYMNGYNWEAFLNRYLEENAPDILDMIETDSEAEMYNVYIDDVTDEGKEMASRFGRIIDELFNDEEAIISFLEENSDTIEWD